MAIIYTERMNFLAHLHLATLANSSLLGNLMADFVRGNPEGLYSASIVSGIRMHRRVDVETDTHPLVREARQLFRPLYRRVAPITLDLIWDHFLSLHWAKIEPDWPLKTFINQTRQQIEPQLCHTPEKFQELNEYMWSQNWLVRYAEPAYIGNALTRMALRRPRLAHLAGSYDDFVQHYTQFEQIFWLFYPQMMDKAAKNAFVSVLQTDQEKKLPLEL